MLKFEFLRASIPRRAGALIASKFVSIIPFYGHKFETPIRARSSANTDRIYRRYWPDAYLKPLDRALTSKLSTSYRRQEDTTFSLTEKRQRYAFKRAGKDQDCVLVVAKMHGKRVAHGIDRRSTNASSRLSQLLAENFVRAW